MLNKNKLVLASVIGTLFIASCSNEMAVESSSDSAGGGKAYAEFMACTAGPDFSAENAMKMIDFQYVRDCHVSPRHAVKPSPTVESVEVKEASDSLKVNENCCS